MMRPFQFICSIASAALLACSAAEGPLDGPTPGSGSLIGSSFSNGPPEAGAVVRSEVGTAFAVVDADADLFSLHSSFGNFFGLCGPFDFIPWDAQTVLRDPTSGFENPEGHPVIAVLKTEEHAIEVYRLSSLIGSPCDWELQAAGSGKIVVHNNDAFSFLRGELVRAASFGWTANGIVETPDGEELHLLAIQKIVQTPSGKISEIGMIKLH